MHPAVYDIAPYRGDTFRRIIRLRLMNEDGTAGAYADLTDCTPLAQVKGAENATTPLQTFITEVLNQSIVGNLGKVRVELAPSQTADLPKKAFWDLQLTHPNGDIHTYLAGKVTPSGQISYGIADAP